MAKTLVYSVLDHPEVCCLFKILAPCSTTLTCKQESGRIAMKLDGNQIDTITAIMVVESALGNSKSIVKTTAGSLDALERATVIQWVEFAYNVAKPNLDKGNDFNQAIFAPLQQALALHTFIARTHVPTIADWLLYCMLFARLRLGLPSVVQSYYRVYRWAHYMSSLLVQSGLSDSKVFNLSTNAFDMKQLELSLIQSTEAGQHVKTTKQGSEVATQNAKTVAPPKQKSDKTSQSNSAKPGAFVPAEHPLARIDLRVGMITHVEKHPAAERLYIETVDLGEQEPRTVVSGLVEHVPIESLQSRLALFVCNLKPATLCKTVSSAMLLVSKQTGEGDQVSLDPLEIPNGAKPGDRVSIKGVTPQPDPVIKPKETTWEDVRSKLHTIDGTACYDSIPLCLTVNEEAHITSTKVPNGVIS